ncbi:MAG: amidase family protein, partial [Phenylobacterium sp.]|uniref:amidase family protein n=1 Tax=Phenylobacterium sp. TaxID=1871053 RepID=UPI002732D114
VIWGKTNTPVMAGDWQTTNKLYGTTSNPWDASRTPGGSSGGAAAALAARVTALEIGSDIGGSLRVPASFCGVFAHKPTWGMVSQHGHVPPRPGAWSERDLNVIGPMARSARDLRLLLSVMEDGPLAPRAPPADLAETRIGLWLDAPDFPLDPQARAVLERLAAALTAAGATVEAISAPVDPESLLRSYLLLLYALLGQDLPPARMRRFERQRIFARFAKDGPNSWTTPVLGFTARHHEWLEADAVRARMRHQMDAVFTRFDVILTPLTPLPAFPHDLRPPAARRLTGTDGAVIAYRSLSAWIALATALGLPATAVPAGLTAQGLPIGAQIIGPRGGDARTLAVAQAIDENIGGFVAPPED